jgi:pheromone shutdown protein TraB
MHTRARATIDPTPARKVLLVANLLLVLTQLLLWIAAFTFAGLLGTLFTRDFFSWWLLVIPTSVLLGAAITALTVQCLRAHDTRLVVAIAVLSMPVYVALAILFTASLTPDR